jgi:uncharacterized protein YutE (UPF0331/DUF86 family)
MIHGILVGKFRTMDEALQELRSLGRITTSQLEDDWRTRKAIERNLQVLTEVMIDVCQRLISLAGQSPVATGADAVQRCVELGILSSVDPYRKMIQFLNFIVHHYEKIDTGILVDIVNHRLTDFDAFKREVIGYVAR